MGEWERQALEERNRLRVELAEVRVALSDAIKDRDKFWKERDALREELKEIVNSRRATTMRQIARAALNPSEK